MEVVRGWKAMTRSSRGIAIRRLAGQHECGPHTGRCRSVCGPHRDGSRWPAERNSRQWLRDSVAQRWLGTVGTVMGQGTTSVPGGQTSHGLPTPCGCGIGAAGRQAFDGVVTIGQPTPVLISDTAPKLVVTGAMDIPCTPAPPS